MNSTKAKDSKTKTPPEEAKEWLMGHDFTEEEAKNLLSCLKADSKEKLLNDLPQWLEWVAYIKQNYDTVVHFAAQGFLNVELGEKGITKGTEDLWIGLKTDASGRPRIQCEPPRFN
jgi:hypothetical protein